MDFTENSLDNRLADDITRFQKNITGITIDDVFIKGATAIDYFELKNLFGIPENPDKPNYFINYYFKKIKHNPKNEVQMWFARQKLVYNVFKTVVAEFPNEFPNDVNIRQDLLKCNIDILMSMKPSSDISIGISPNKSVFKIGDLIHYIENVGFIKKYGFSSLNIGIEYSASMLQYNGNYLLDVSDLKQENKAYNSMVSLALTGVYRNLNKRTPIATLPNGDVIFRLLDDRLNGISEYFPKENSLTTDYQLTENETIKIDGRRKLNREEIMIPRIVYMEPELWRLYDRLGAAKKKTRSTFIRCELKDHRRKMLSKIPFIDWSESNL